MPELGVKRARAADAFVDDFTRPGHGLNVGSAEDAREKQENRRLVELVQRSSRHMLSMCSEERDFERPGGLWRPGIRFFSLLACH